MSAYFKILVADDVSETGLEPLLEAGFAVEKSIGLSYQQLRDKLSVCDGLIVRSETKVTGALLSEAIRLRAIGRAGVGVDNIDVTAATARGIVVMNAPDGNTITTAEHTIALMISLARRIPQANASLKAGLWERKRFLGDELRGKTLGILGLGRIGRVVAARARCFDMNVIAHDPFVAPDHARDLDLEIVAIDDLFQRSDFLTVHTPLSSETRGIIGKQAFEMMKKGVKLINCARGGLIDERELLAAIRTGKVSGAALDVFEQEPPSAGEPLLALDEVIATPHLGASTREAQEGVAIIVSEQMRDYFLSGAVRGAVNVPAVAAQEMNVLQPYLDLAERLGRFQAQLVDEAVREVSLEYAGELADIDAAAVTRAFLAAFLRDMSARVNVVNAFLIASERGLIVTASYRRSIGEFAPAITTKVTTIKGQHSLSGTLFGQSGQKDRGRIVEIDGFHIEAIPNGHLVIMRNRDVPGVIGKVGNIFGQQGINVSRFHLGRRERGGEAMAVIEIDAPLDRQILEKLRSLDEVLAARPIDLTGV